MIEKTYYIENTENLESTLKELENIPCFINRRFIEMNYSKLIIRAKAEYIDAIDKIMKTLDK